MKKILEIFITFIIGFCIVFGFIIESGLLAILGFGLFLGFIFGIIMMGLDL